ncbi:peptidylprolyl isomerase [Hoeflea sp.]|uniref:peptidylprolyl isomerase n=1 Tax=Hoeflea sp. TaxID=1940281 RepID=UPI003B019EE1
MMKYRLPWRAGIVALAVCLSAGAAAQDSEDKVIATVGGKPVYQSELSFVEESDPQISRLPADQRTATALSTLLDIKLLAQQAENAGFGKDQAFQRRLDFLKDRELHNLFFKNRVIDGLTEEAVRERYDREVAATPPEQEVKARHILVDSEEQAKTVITELDGGKDFIELAQEKSTGPSGPQGGDLGYFTRGRMVPEFEEAAFALETGTYTKEPVKTQFGWHVIKVEDKRDTPPPNFEQVANQIQRILLQEQYLALLQEGREAVKVEITDEDLQKLFGGVDAQGNN